MPGLSVSYELFPTEFSACLLPGGVQLLHEGKELVFLLLRQSGEHRLPAGLRLFRVLPRPGSARGCEGYIRRAAIRQTGRADEHPRLFQLADDLAGGAGLDAQLLRQLPLGHLPFLLQDGKDPSLAAFVLHMVSGVPQDAEHCQELPVHIVRQIPGTFGYVTMGMRRTAVPVGSVLPGSVRPVILGAMRAVLMRLVGGRAVVPELPRHFRRQIVSAAALSFRQLPGTGKGLSPLAARHGQITVTAAAGTNTSIFVQAIHFLSKFI